MTEKSIYFNLEPPTVDICINANEVDVSSGIHPGETIPYLSGDDAVYGIVRFADYAVCSMNKAPKTRCSRLAGFKSCMSCVHSHGLHHRCAQLVEVSSGKACRRNRSLEMRMRQKQPLLRLLGYNTVNTAKYTSPSTSIFRQHLPCAFTATLYSLQICRDHMPRV